MKKLVMLLVMMFVASYGHAETTSKSSHPVGGGSPHSVSIREHTHEYDARGFDRDNTIDLSVGADMPYLVEVWDDLYIGAEGEKIVNGTSGEEGWSAMAKVTYNGTWLNLNPRSRKKK